MNAFTLLLRAVLLWLAMMTAETAFGALRRLVFGGEPPPIARQASVVLGAIMIFAVAWLSRRWLAIRTEQDAFAIGVLWTGFTLLYEVAVGHALGLRWGDLMADYDLSRGGLMPLALVFLAFTPWIVLRLKRAA